MGEVKLSLRTHRSRISTILKEGLKNSFEVEPTAWWMTQTVDDYFEQRKKAEYHALGVPLEAKAENRPVYGFARLSDDFTTGVGGQTSYGEVLITLRNSENLRAVASGGRKRGQPGDTMGLVARVVRDSMRVPREYVLDPETQEPIIGTLPLRQALEEGRLFSTGISGSVSLNTRDRMTYLEEAQNFESVPIPREETSEFLKQVSSLVQEVPNASADDYVEISFFDRLKAGDIESIDIIRRPFDTTSAPTKDAPEALKSGLAGIRGEEAAQRLLQAAQEDIDLAASLRAQLDEAGLSHIPIRTGVTIPIHGVGPHDQSLISNLESLGGFRYSGGMIMERTVFDTAEQTAEQLLGIDTIFQSEEFAKLAAPMIPSRAFHVKNIKLNSGILAPMDEIIKRGATAPVSQTVPSTVVREAESVLKEAIVEGHVSTTSAKIAEAASTEISKVGSAVMRPKTLDRIIRAGETAARIIRFKK